MAKIGYARVSTEEQNLDRQLDALKERGVERVFLEKVSGIKVDRPELSRLLDFIREGDTVIVESISRLARSIRDLLRIVDEIQEKKTELIIIKESVDTSTPYGKFALTLFGAMAELERDIIRQRQREGIEAARRRGKSIGRPRVKKPENFDRVVKKYEAGKLKAVEAIRQLGLPKATFYKLVKESKYLAAMQQNNPP